MKNNYRYLIRKEFFGGLMYDRQLDKYTPIDEQFFSILENCYDSNHYQHLPEKYISFFKREEIIKDDLFNFKLIRNPAQTHTLSAPIRIHYGYTYGCNLNCKHCYTKLQKHEKDELSFAEKIHMLDQMQSLGIAEILIGGGEPLVKKDILQFIDACEEHDINVKLYTNGLLLDENMCKELAKRSLTYISMSIDGTSEEEYEKTRGVQGLSKVMNSVQLAKKYLAVPVACSVTVNEFNYKNANGYLKIAKKIGVDHLTVRATKPVGNVLLNNEIYSLPEQYLSFMCEMQRIWNQEYKDDFQIDYSWGNARIQYNVKTNSMEVIDNAFPYYGFGCFAGKGSMVIRANGEVSPCGFLPEEMQTTKGDNIRNKSLKQLWDTGEKFTALREIPANDECPNCRYYQVCRGGCIARILYAGGKMNDVDPWCLKKYFPVKI